MSLSVRRSAPRVLLALLVAFSSLLVAAPAQAQKIDSDFFGMHGAGALNRLQVGSIRLWDSGTSWREIEGGDDLWNFDNLDMAVSKALAAGARPLVVLGQTPQFHATNPGAPGAYGPGATSMPTVSAWTRYVRKVAERYGSSADYQVWNEPNVTNYWTGSVAQMATLTQTASNTIRSVAPGARVVAPAFPLRLAGQQKWYRAFWASKVGGKPVSSYVDVVSVNLYPLADQAPEASMSLARFAKDVLPKAARSKPMWNTEINYGLKGGAAPDAISEAKQAAYVARTLVLNAAGPIRKVFWYSWNIGPIANTYLVKSDGVSLTRAGKAWGVARAWINTTNVGRCAKTVTGRLKGLYTCTATRGTTEVRRIYWKPTGSAVRIATHRTTRAWTALSGVRTARKGTFRIKVGQLPVMVSSRK